jgi:signal transduction histidine kinase
VKNPNNIITKWEIFLNYAREHRIFKTVKLECGNNTDSIKLGYMTGSQLAERQESSIDLIRAARPYIENLSLCFYEKPHVVALLDQDGWIIQTSDYLDNTKGSIHAFATGTNWSERYTGIRGLGTSLITGQPTFVYDIRIHASLPDTFCCYEIPIRIDDDVTGALAVFLPSKEAKPECLIIALASVECLQNHYYISQVQAQILQMEQVIAAGSLLASTVHDIKNPLTVIRGIAQLGSIMATTNKEMEYFNKIVEQVDSLSKMLNDFIGVFNNNEYVNYSPEVIIREIFDEIDPLCQIQNIRLKLKSYTALTCKVQPGLLKRALHNLIKNATQVLPDGGIIKVELKRLNNWVHIAIADNGPGIPAEIQENIFQPFVKGNKNGTGLGLFMVQYVITKVHKGKIWFETRQGQGTTFHIELPSDG